MSALKKADKVAKISVNRVTGEAVGEYKNGDHQKHNDTGASVEDQIADTTSYDPM